MARVLYLILTVIFVFMAFHSALANSSSPSPSTGSPTTPKTNSSIPKRKFVLLVDTFNTGIYRSFMNASAGKGYMWDLLKFLKAGLRTNLWFLEPDQELAIVCFDQLGTTTPSVLLDLAPFSNSSLDALNPLEQAFQNRSWSSPDRDNTNIYSDLCAGYNKTVELLEKHNSVNGTDILLITRGNVSENCLQDIPNDARKRNLKLHVIVFAQDDPPAPQITKLYKFVSSTGGTGPTIITFRYMPRNTDPQYVFDHVPEVKPILELSSALNKFFSRYNSYSYKIDLQHSILKYGDLDLKHLMNAGPGYEVRIFAFRFEPVLSKEPQDKAQVAITYNSKIYTEKEARTVYYGTTDGTFVLYTWPSNEIQAQEFATLVPQLSFRFEGTASRSYIAVVSSNFKVATETSTSSSPTTNPTTIISASTSANISSNASTDTSANTTVISSAALRVFPLYRFDTNQVFIGPFLSFVLVHLILWAIQ